jgi:hypothetical protein
MMTTMEEANRDDEKKTGDGTRVRYLGIEKTNNQTSADLFVVVCVVWGLFRSLRR